MNVARTLPWAFLACCAPVCAQQQISPNPNPLGNSVTISTTQDFNADFFYNYGSLFISGGSTPGWLTNRDGGDLYNAAGAVLSVSGTLDNQGQGTLWNLGDLAIQSAGTVSNQGSLLLQATGVARVWGTLDNGNTGVIDQAGQLVLQASGTLNNQGMLSNLSGASLQSLGSVSNSGFLDNSGTLDIQQGTWNNSGFFSNQATGSLSNRQSFYNNLGGLLINSGTVTNQGTYVNRGEIIQDAGASWSNWGTLDLQAGGRLENRGVLDNNLSGSIINRGLFENYGTVQGSGTFQNLGTLTGDGSFLGDVVDGGVLSPSDPTGALSINGNLNKTGGAFETLFASNRFSSLSVTGDVALSGSLSVFGSNLAAGEFVVLDVGGSLTGQFSGLGEGDQVKRLGAWDVTITYAGGDGNDVALRVTSVPEPAPWLAGLAILLGGTACARRKGPACRLLPRPHATTGHPVT